MAPQVATSHIEPDIAVVRIFGNLTFEEAGSVASSIRALLDHGVKRLILDLSGVEQIDRLGGTSLIRCFFAAREAAASLCVARASTPVVQLFKTTRVDTLIPFFPTMAAARDHFNDTPRAGAETA